MDISQSNVESSPKANGDFSANLEEKMDTSAATDTGIDNKRSNQMESGTVDDLDIRFKIPQSSLGISQIHLFSSLSNSRDL